MRISDWSSDVCSSDLIGSTAERLEGRAMNADDMKVETFACVFDAIADTPEEATELRTRADLMRGITARVKSWDVPLGEAAKRLGLTPPRLNDLLRGKFNRFSLDDLMTAATAAGIAPPAPRKSSWDDLRGIVKGNGARFTRSEEHTSELQSLMRISYAVFCLKQTNN